MFLDVDHQDGRVLSGAHMLTWRRERGMLSGGATKPKKGPLLVTPTILNHAARLARSASDGNILVLLPADLGKVVKGSICWVRVILVGSPGQEAAII